MPRARVFEIEGFEQTDLPILARVWHVGALIVPESLDSVSYSVRSAAGTLTSSGSWEPSTVVFWELQTDLRWTKDATGYNFLATIPAACFPSPGMHIVEIKFTPTSGSPFWIVAKSRMLSLHTV